MNAIYHELYDFLHNNAENTWFFISENPFLGLCICDRDGTILHVNKVYSYITGEDAQTVVGRSLGEGTNSGHAHCSLALEVLRYGQPRIKEHVNRGKGYLIKSLPVYHHEELAYVASLLLDVSHERSLEANLKKAQKSNNLLQQKIYELQALLNEQQDEPLTLQDPPWLYVSKPMRDLHQHMQQIASSGTMVLLSGESGVGKAFAAKILHQMGNRASKPFISIHCATLPSGVLEAELFGCGKGTARSETPANQAGAFEAARGGTIFLQAIDQMPPKLQARLMRLLNQLAVDRVRSVPAKPLDVRIIAASSKDLKGCVAAKTFRKDLYSRLSALELLIPPLRERREDIPVLASFFLDRFNRKYMRNKHISTKGYASLTGLPYEGNARQLENMIERLVLLCPHGTIQPKDIDHFYAMTSGPLPTLADPLLEPDTGNWKERVLSEEASMMLSLKAQGFNTYQIAQKLGLHQSTVWRKLKKIQQDHLST